MNARNLAAAAALLVASFATAGCKKECTTLRGGGCTSGSEHCGAVLQCGDRKLDFKCDLPDVKNNSTPLSFPLTCHCIEDGVEMKTARLATAVQGLDDGAKAARTACGWEQR